MYSPLEQFEVYPLLPLRRGGLDLSFTNSSLRRLLAAGLVVVWGQLVVTGGGGRVVPNAWQTSLEGVYRRVRSRAQDRGPRGREFFPLLFVLFTFIAACNLLGLVPYSFTVTSHLVVTLTLAGRVWIGKLVVGLREHGVKLLGRFLPSGVPIVRAPALIAIELITFTITVISLSVRLFANRRSGHILLKVLAGFAWTRRRAGGVVFLGHFLPLGVLFLLRGLETGVALIQAYVFTLLTSRYISDVLEGGH